MTFEILRSLDYKAAKKVISKMDNTEKKELLHDLENHYNNTSSSLKGYYNTCFKPSPINKKDYFIIMSIIKKLEVLMSYCYE